MKNQKEKYQEYGLLLDILDEHFENQHQLEKTIEALKNNEQYRSLFPKNHLSKKEKEKEKIDFIIEALLHYRDSKIEDL